jgi:hypothetical protein
MKPIPKQGLLAVAVGLFVFAAPQLPGRAIVADGAAHIDAGELDEAVSRLTVASPSAAALYDLGVAWFKKGDAVHALGAFRAASEAAPRDGDIAHNLAVVRLAFSEAPEPAGPAVAWAALITPGELGVLALLSWLAAAAWARRAQADHDGLVGAWGAVGLSAALSLVAVDGSFADAGSAPAVVHSAVALRGAPEITDRVLGYLSVGTEVRVDARTADFARVEDGEGRRGWVPRAALYAPTIDPSYTGP